MKTANGITVFGLFKGMGYRDCNDVFEDYLRYKNNLPKEVIINRMKNLEFAVAGFPVTDIFSGKEDGVGALFEDGSFRFPVQFLRYYETYDIGIPPEYESYLVNVVGLK